MTPDVEEHVSHPPENIFFVCGPGHSGTSLMLAILDSHPDITAIQGETGIFHRIRDDGELLKRVASWPQQHALSGRYVAEKTPVHAFYLERLLRLFPQSRVIYMMRDGRDVTVSAAHRLQDYAKALHEWIKLSKPALSYAAHRQVHLVRYETLVESPASTIRSVCDFLGVTFDSTMLRHHTIERHWWDLEVRDAESGAPLVGENHKRHRNWQINQPIFNGSGRWRTEMTAEQKHTFKQRAGELLVALGYASDTNW